MVSGESFSRGEKVEELNGGRVKLLVDIEFDPTEAVRFKCLIRRQVRFWKSHRAE